MLIDAIARYDAMMPATPCCRYVAMLLRGERRHKAGAYAIAVSLLLPCHYFMCRYLRRFSCYYADA